MIVYVSGGARSGKSRFAEAYAARPGDDVTYLATAQAFDDEMRERIARHRGDRPAAWHTAEEPLDVAQAARNIRTPTLLLDCLSLWVSNLLLAGESEDRMLAATDDLLAALRERGGLSVLVSNEVGLGIVPDNALARTYRDALGRVNQRVAAASDEAYLLVSGLPLQLKGQP
ncbi:bifunctional adenosylcobinamide kinase/adenosylcobinamide-phosphate guanylyltransferase [uncultured Deinococcus sp.]|uniref:bifunctional adenosylcobinamide kinase/adenosylcobinamide-phosphate guanylyltransferase n=1 Tax=uncultured Deinococcus sp. TaxID=158789 RepID=UPI00258C0F97|nr:bifunctional adenosylcobinamide kinase/adenosylcobinamide-phosphate guanylyltransferase [uncultured Deinococcus sp.]